MTRLNLRPVGFTSNGPFFFGSGIFTARIEHTRELMMMKEVKAGQGTGLGAGILFYCPETNRVLLVKRSDTGDAAGTWACLGGGVEQGESLTEGAMRECREEGRYDNLEHGPVKLHHLAVCCTPSGFSYHNYLGVVPKEWTPVLNHEHTEHGWFGLGELPSPLHPNFAEALRARNLI